MIDDLVSAELARPLAPEVRAFAAALAGPQAVAVLFYGSCLQDGTTDGMLDFYVLTDRPRLIDRILPPTVHFASHGGLRAKVAIMGLDDFRRAMRPDAPSSHLWARFCQPVALAWGRDDDAKDEVRRAILAAIAAAAWWAARLGGWSELFCHTYAAELRAERSDRPARLAQGARWALIPLEPAPRRSWGWRRPLGKLLAAARLIKAAFTVPGGADYLAWKIERHTGRAIPLTPWQRRHPLLAALPLLVRLKRQGLVR